MINTTLRNKLLELSKTYSLQTIDDTVEYLKVRKEWLDQVDKYGWADLRNIKELPIDFAIEFQSKVNWQSLSMINYTIPKEYTDKLDWLSVFLKYKLHSSFIKTNHLYIKDAILKKLDYDEIISEKKTSVLGMYLITEIPEILIKYQSEIKEIVLNKLGITADSIWK